jgi:hypothetical protein
MTFTLVAAALVAPAADPLPVPPGPIAPLSPAAVPPATDPIPPPLSPAALAPPPAADGTRYYFILFGGQSVPYHPRTAHTWATFVKATPADGKMLVESFTISWLPVTAEVRPLRLHAEPGKNFTLEETFAIAESNRDRISMWGPFEIDAAWYERAVVQAARLESGVVQYRVLDSFGLNDRVQHCVRAITSSDTTRQLRLQPVLQVGEPGTSRLATKYARNGAFVGGPVTHDWVIPAVGLDRFPVVRRAVGERVRREWR